MKPRHPRPAKRRPAAGLAVLIALLTACGGGGSGSSPSTPLASAPSCELAPRQAALADYMQQWYFWYHELPLLDAARYNDLESYFRALLKRPLDRYSTMLPQSLVDQTLDEAVFVSHGIHWSGLDPQLPIEVNDVVDGSAAAAAGVRRGQRLFTLPDGKRAGYIVFNTFVGRQTVAALDPALRSLHAQGAEELILDLRYNSGGLVEMVADVGSLLAGPAASGRNFLQLVHNDRQRASDAWLLLRALGADTPLPLERLIILTSRATISAPEALINALQGIAGGPRPLGDAGEGLLASALSYLASGRCSRAQAAAAAPSTASAAARPPRDLGALR